MTQPFPFPFVGVRDGGMPRGGFVGVCFVRAVPPKERGAVVAGLPPEVARHAHWQGAFLSLPIHPGVGAEDGALGRACGAALRAVHEVEPVLVALQHDGREQANDAPWHRWSLAQLATLAPRVAAQGAGADDFLDSLASLSDGVLERPTPGGALLRALDRGDTAALRRALALADADDLEVLASGARWQLVARARCLAGALDAAHLPLPLELHLAWARGHLLEGDGPRLPTTFAPIARRIDEAGHAVAVGADLFRAAYAAMDDAPQRAARWAAASAGFDHPERAMACANGSILLARCGDQRGCYELSGRGLVHAPTDPFLLDAHLGSAVLLGIAGEVTDDVQAHAVEAVAAAPTLCLNTTAVAVESRRYAAGVAALDRWDAVHDERPSGLHLNAAVLLWGAGELAGADEATEAARRAGDPGAGMVEAALRFHHGDTAGARAAFQEVKQGYGRFLDWAGDHLMEGPRADPVIDELFAG